MYMNHLLFTFKNINVRVRILDDKKKKKKKKKKSEKLKKVHLQNDLYIRY